MKFSRTSALPIGDKPQQQKTTKGYILRIQLTNEQEKEKETCC